MSNFNKLKLYPSVSIKGGTNKQGPVKVKRESRNYGIKGEYDLYDKKDTKITISGNYSKSSGRDKVTYKGKDYVFKGESDPSYGIGITIKKKFKTGGLTKWFNEKWVDIGAKKKGGKYQECGRKSASGSKRKYPKCVPLAKATAMSKSQKASAVARKRSASNAGPKPTNVRT